MSPDIFNDIIAHTIPICFLQKIHLALLLHFFDRKDTKLFTHLQHTGVENISTFYRLMACYVEKLRELSIY